MVRATILCLLLICGCGKNEGTAMPMRFEDVPKEMVERARKELPEVTFDSARKRSNGNIEVRGKDKRGKVREVEFNAAGELVEIE